MKYNHSGFSLVELVMVLVVVGILSVSAMGLFATKSDFSASLAKDQLISSVHLAQQRALASHTTDPVFLDITQTSKEWIFAVRQGSITSNSQTAEHAGANLTIAGLSLPASIEFAQSGSLASAGDLALTFTGETSHSVCISSAGFAFATACP
jgi:MSHA pilin protein MshC